MKLLIKIGGTLVDEPAQRAAVAQQIASASRAGHSVVAVHGGGRQLTRFLEERGITSRFVNGLRVTTEDALDAVLKVLAGSVNKELVGALRASGVNAVGLSGIDGGLANAEQMAADLGRVGRVTAVDPSVLHVLIAARMLPVVACVAGDDAGRAWNINADQMAVACARALAADRLIFLTDVSGVMDESGTVLSSLTPSTARALIQAGVARGGMQAKLESAIAAVSDGVGAVAIAPGALAGVLEQLLAGQRCGTEITAR